jgi:hypothetical protein
MERTLGCVKRLAVLNGHRNSVVGFANPALSLIGHTLTHPETLPREPLSFLSGSNERARSRAVGTAHLTVLDHSIAHPGSRWVETAREDADS